MTRAELLQENAEAVERANLEALRKAQKRSQSDWRARLGYLEGIPRPRTSGGVS